MDLSSFPFINLTAAAVHRVDLNCWVFMYYNDILQPTDAGGNIGEEKETKCGVRG